MLDMRQIELAATLGDAISIELYKSRPFLYWLNWGQRLDIINQVMDYLVIRDVKKTLNLKHLLLTSYACDLAEHVLHIFEDKYPEDKRPREAIKLAREFVLGLDIDKKKLEKTWEDIQVLVGSIFDSDNMAACNAVDSAGQAVFIAFAPSDVISACVASSCQYASDVYLDDKVRQAEHSWQQARLVKYLMGEIKVIKD